MSRLGAVPMGADYNKYSAGQGAMVVSGLPLLARAAAEIADPAGRTAVVSDFAAAHGRNSLSPMGLAVDALLGRGASAVQVFHTDLPGNDFSTLLKLVSGDGSYAAGRPNVFPSAMARDFRLRCFPDRSLDLAWCSAAQHWRSKPNPSPDIALITPELVALAGQDWATYLACREAELAPGGQVIHCEGCRDAKDLVGNERWSSATLKIFEESFGEPPPPYPAYWRGEAEWRKPFESGETGLILKEFETVTVDKSVQYEGYLQSGDLDAYVDATVGAYMAAAAGVSGISKYPQEQQDRYYSRIKQAIRADPEGMQFVRINYCVFRFQKPL
ncbi:S-adenosyl-L-methionine-dependent methyltransferase [Hyaloraphidium curvatum]|nr:S-adenosyl-L-methionine-dependent methyltransferase [Hyaloraphidium curvatum]